MNAQIQYIDSTGNVVQRGQLLADAVYGVPVRKQLLLDLAGGFTGLQCIAHYHKIFLSHYLFQCHTVYLRLMICSYCNRFGQKLQDLWNFDEMRVIMQKRTDEK